MKQNKILKKINNKQIRILQDNQTNKQTKRAKENTQEMNKYRQRDTWFAHTGIPQNPKLEAIIYTQSGRPKQEKYTLYTLQVKGSAAVKNKFLCVLCLFDSSAPHVLDYT